MEKTTEVASRPVESLEARAYGPRRWTSRFGVRLGAVAVGAALLRLFYTIGYQDSQVTSDGLHYSMAARFLAEGRGFINPLSLMFNGSIVEDGVHPPAWTVVLAAVTKTGRETNLDFRIVAALVGVATVVMVGLAAREAFGSRVGLVAAGLAAVYPNLWLYEHELVSEPLALLGVATLLFLTYRFRRTPGAWLAAALGLVVGCCALTRAELILLSVLVVVPVVLSVRALPLARRAAWLVLAGVGCLVVIAPWFAYNSTRFDAPVPISAGLGAAIAAGNCPNTYDPSTPKYAYYEFGCVLLIPVTGKDPAIDDDERRAFVLSFIGQHKGEFAVTSAARLGRAFSFYAPFQQVELESERGTETWVLTLALVCYWVLLPLGVYGFVVARRRHIPVYPLIALVVVAVVAVVPTIGAVRYRAPAEIALVVLAAVGIDAVARLAARRGSARSTVAAPARGGLAPSS